MAITINTRIQNKSDYLSNWVESDLILLKGELASVVLSSNNIKLKVGDGKTKFTDLPYVYDSQFNDIQKLINIIGNDYLTSEDKHDIFNRCVENDELSLFLSGNSLVLDIAGISHYIGLSDEYSLKANTVSMFESLTSMISATNASLAETEARVSANIPKIYVSEDGGTNLEQVNELKLINIGAEEYFKLVKSGEVLSNAIYEISSDFSNVFGQQIKNVANPTDETDAATKNYVDSRIENILDDCTTSVQVSTIVDAFGFSSTYVDGIKTDLSTMHISEDDYFELVKNDSIMSNMIYVVSSDEDNHFGERITNLGEPILSSDAATKNYVDNNGTTTIVEWDSPEDVDFVLDDSIYDGMLQRVDERLSAKQDKIFATGLLSSDGEGKIVGTQVDLSQYHTKSEISSIYAKKQYVDEQLLKIDVSQQLDDYAKKNNVIISYDNINHKIVLSADGNVTDIDATSFIKDGMLSSADLVDDTLILKFNTDSGSNPISVSLNKFIDNYDTKISELSGNINELQSESQEFMKYQDVVDTCGQMTSELIKFQEIDIIEQD